MSFNLKPREISWLDDYIIEDLFPVGDIHLIAGASGAGKTTWLIKTLDSWRKGNSVFGHKSRPRPFIYLSGDRSEAGVRRTFNRIGVDYRDFPIYVPRGQDRMIPLVDVLKKIKLLDPTIELFVIEGLAARVPGGKVNDYNAVSSFLLGLQEFCESTASTIIGVVHTAKTKEGESYQDPRQKALGSVGWAGFTETIVLVEAIEVEDPRKQTRKITTMPRNSRSEVFKLEFGDDGYLIPVENVQEHNTKLNDKIKDFFGSLESGETFTPNDVMKHTKISRSRVNILLAQALKEGYIIKAGFGEYILSPGEEKPSSPEVATDPTEDFFNE